MPPSASRLQIVERSVDDVTVLVLAGQILLDDGDLAIRKRIHELIEKGHVKIVADLADVTYIDSSGIGMLVAKVGTIRQKGGDIKLVRLTRRTQNLLSTLKLMMVFEMFDDEASAIRSFSWRARTDGAQSH